MKRLKICVNRVEAEVIIHELNKQKIVGLMKAYSGTEVDLQDKLEVLVNDDDFSNAKKIIENV